MAADEPTIAQKLRANLAALREQGASPEELHAEIGRAQSAMQKKGRDEAQSARSGWDQVGAGAQSFSDSATLGLSGLLDDAGTAVLSPNARFADLRDARKTNKSDFGEAHPVLNTGLQLAGALATPGFGVAKLLGNAGRLARIGGAMGEGAAQAGVSGAINNTDDFSTDATGRALLQGGKEALIGGATAPVAGALVGKLGKTAADWWSRAESSPSVRRVVTELGDAASPVLKAAVNKLGILTKRGLGDETMVADVLGKRGTTGQRLLRAAGNSSPDAEATAATVLRNRNARVGDRAEAAIADATGLPISDTRLAREEMTTAQRAEADRLFGQARQEGAAFDAIPSKVAQRWGALEQAAEQKALPAPGQSVSAKRDLPRVVENIAPFHEVPVESVDQAVSRRAGGSMFDGGVPTTRRVELRAANDVNVRREPVVAEPATGGRDAFQHAEGLKQKALSDAHVQDQLQSLYSEDAALEKADPGSFDVMSRLYQRMNKEFGRLQKNGNDAGEYWNALNRARNKVRQALDVRSPTFPAANAAFAGKAKLDDAYEMGTQLFNKPAGELRVAQAKMSAEESRNFKRGLFDAIVEGKVDPRAPNPDLGAAGRQASPAGRAAVDTRAAQKRLQEVLEPEEYRKLISAAKSEGLFASTSNQAMGNSTTAKQLNDMGVFESLAGDMVGSAVGAPMGTAGLLRRGGQKALDLATMGAHRKAGTEMANALTNRGADASGFLNQLAAEIARRQTAATVGARLVAPTARVTARMIGNQ